MAQSVAVLYKIWLNVGRYKQAVLLGIKCPPPKESMILTIISVKIKQTSLGCVGHEEDGMKAITKINTVEVKNGKQHFYVGAYADNKTAQRVREIVKDLVPVGFNLSKGEK